DETGKMQRQLGHVQLAVHDAQLAQHGRPGVTENICREPGIDTIMAGRNWCMRGKNTATTNGLNIGLDEASAAPMSNLLFEQRHRDQGRMTFIHVKGIYPRMAQCAEHGDATDAEQYFLAQPVTFVAAIEVIG